MINKQRVQRIRGFIYTCIILAIVVPIILMLVVSFRTLGTLDRLADYFEQNPPVTSRQPDADTVSSSRADDGGIPEHADVSDAPAEQPVILEPDDAVNAIEEAVAEENETPAEDGRFVKNTYLPASYPELRFDTLPVTVPLEKDAIYLTFDNTPSSQAEGILAVLDKHGVKATFFVWWNDGRYTENLDFYKRLYQDGHRIGIHAGSSQTSYSELYADTEAFLGQLEHIFAAIYEATGEKTRLYRFPGGSVNPYNAERQKLIGSIKTELDARGFLQYDWSASAQDAVSPPLTKARALDNIKSSMRDGGQVVVLLHDGTGSTATAEALDEFISQYKADGYSFGVLEYYAEPVSFLGS